MTNFERIRNYYKNFDEKNRLKNDASGRLEFLMTMSVLEKHLPSAGGTNNGAGAVTVLDIGGGAGAYAFPLAERGYKVTLADLSEELISQAKAQKAAENARNIVSCDIANATNLSIYKDNQFDVVLLLGPLYHLLEESERKLCVSEIRRVLKPHGKIFASFIPYLSGSIGIVERYWFHPEQVGIDNLTEVFKSGKFNNLINQGFQEGYYPKSAEIERLFADNGFEKDLLRSVRGFGYQKEEQLFKIADAQIFDKIIELIDSTAEDKAIVETCGHAIYVGHKS
ncbi:MAG: methyltransferase domain-containing protein [Spirochaetaceae bacterium]|nr:methyltransferase domain-containing protein [Spirochaetaceae bacterium]